MISNKLIISIVVLIILIIVVVLSLFLTPSSSKNAICGNGKLTRAEQCMKVYKLPDYRVTFSTFNKNNIISYEAGKYYRLKDFYIASSYMTAHPCGHTNDVVSLNNIKHVLNKGARFIYFDLFFKPREIYNKDYYDPESQIVVENVIDGKPSVLKKCGPKNQYLNINACFKTINSTAWVGKKDYPLILYLNFKMPQLQFFEYSVYTAIYKHLRSRLLSPIYSFQNKNIGDAPINDLMGKLIIITNRLPINPSFNEFVNCVTTIKRNPNPFFVRYDMNKVLVDSGGIANKFITKAAGIKDMSNSLHMVTYNSGPNENNIFVWKVDSKNTDPQSAFEYGVQIFCMNYQSYDQAMQKYLNTALNPTEFPGKTFSNSSFIRKTCEYDFITQTTEISIQ